MMKAKTPQNKLMKIITMPIRALARARDFYVRSMNNYADKACYGGGMTYADPLPRSFSTTNSTRSNSDNDDFRDLVRAASTNTLGNRINNLSSVLANNGGHDHGTTTPTTTTTTTTSSSVFRNKVNNNNNNNNNNTQNYSGVVRGVPRSASVGMAKIEEDKPIEFDDNYFDAGNNKLGFGAKNRKNAKNNNNNNNNNKFGIFPRSRSYAVGATKRTTSVF